MNNSNHSFAKVDYDLDKAIRSVEMLLRFGTAAASAGYGFGRLNDEGNLIENSPVSLLRTSRYTFAYSIGQIIGLKFAEDIAQKGVAELSENFWLPDVNLFGIRKSNTPCLSAYDHAFVCLAATAAYSAGVPGSELLLSRAESVVSTRLWDEATGVFRDLANQGESWDLTYLGANANMHWVEAALALEHVTSGGIWQTRARRVVNYFILERASALNWMLCEHYHYDGSPDLEYNRSRMNDEFRPFGVTIGHLFEWSRLIGELESRDPVRAEASCIAQRALYETGSTKGWARDGKPGFCYTSEYDGTPLSFVRPHWVVCEAIASAATITHQGVSDSSSDLSTWTEYASTYFIDKRNGSWRNEIDANNQPSSHIFHGRTDLYHAINASMIPALPVARSLVERIEISKGLSC